MNNRYPTDLTDTQWQFIKKNLLFDKRKRKNDFGRRKGKQSSFRLKGELKIGHSQIA